MWLTRCNYGGKTKDQLVLWIHKPELNPCEDGFVSSAGEFDFLELECGTQNLFPEVTFENSPVEVELKLLSSMKEMRYPATYAECCMIVGDLYEDDSVTGYRYTLLGKFQQLLRCRDAYWVLADDWEPDFSSNNQIKYSISIWGDSYLLDFYYCKVSPSRLVFPTKEMRDAFFENFKELINDCKELI